MDDLKNKPVLVGIAFLLPLLFVAIIFLTTYIPSIRLSTDFDFIYATCSEFNSPYNYSCSYYLNRLYVIENGTLTVKPVPADLDSDQDNIPDIEENYRTRLFFHDTEINESREISLAAAQKYKFSELLTSPDGVTVEWEYARGNGFFLFYSTSSQYGYYLTKGSARKKLSLINNSDRYYYQGNFNFIGWVMD